MNGGDAEESDDDFGFGEASRYAAHLDRGWAMLDRGDHAAARTSAEHARETRPEDPDAAVLLGAVALAERDPEESLRWYDRAIELDPEYLEPYTAAAQVCLYDLDTPPRALRYCEDALELETLTPFDSLDLHLLAAECELVLEQDDLARRRLATLDEESVLMSVLRLGSRPDLLEEVDASDPDSEAAVASAYLQHDADEEPLDEEDRVDRIGRALHLAFRLARMRLDLGDTDGAIEPLLEILRWYPGEADAWYLASEAHHRAGQLPEACVAGVKTLELDHELPVPDWIPSFALVHRRVVQLLRDCPEPTIGALVDTGRPLTVMVRDAPAPELVMEGVDPRTVVLALAARPAPPPPPEASAKGKTSKAKSKTKSKSKTQSKTQAKTQAKAQPKTGTEVPSEATEPPQLTGVAVYRRNLARYAHDAEHFYQELGYAVLDELAAFVGLPDEVRDRLGLPPMLGGSGGGGGEPVATEATTDEGAADDAKAKGKRKRKTKRRTRAVH